jgi:hypothetical protein
MTEAVSASETSVSIYQTRQCNIPEDSHLIFIIYLLLPFGMEKSVRNNNTKNLFIVNNTYLI